MSSAPANAARAEASTSVRRVRHQARDAVVLMTFSLLTSLLLAVAFLLLAGLGR